jgi:hypothetical protein
MHWFTAEDGTRFLIQTPMECAHSLAGAFPDPSVAVTSRRFMAQVKAECPAPGEDPRGKATATVRITRRPKGPDSC